MDEDREIQRRHYLRHRDKIIARVKAWTLAHPEKKKEYARKYREKARGKLREASKAYNRGRPNQIHDTYLKRNYGISRADYEVLLKAQNGLCAICRKSESRCSGRGRINRLSVDYDHSDGRVRALLCARCNHIIGRSGESVQLLREIISYLDHHSLHRNSE